MKIENHDKLIHFFKKAADDVISAQNTPLYSEKSPIINQTTDDFFEFGSSASSASTGTTKSELEVLHFLSDEENNLNNLEKYPIIKQVFIRYNTPLPSSAPVERLFSFATMINQPRSHKLSDQLF